MLTCFDVSRRLYSKSYLRMKCLSFPCASWAASVSIFYEPQPNHCVRIISHQLGYTTAENIFWRRLISEEGALEESGGLPQRSENGSLRYSEESNFAVTLCSIQPNDLLSEIPDSLFDCNVEECAANVAMSVYALGPNT